MLIECRKGRKGRDKLKVKEVEIKKNMFAAMSFTPRNRRVSERI
jgi:hypothetical protein